MVPMSASLLASLRLVLQLLETRFGHTKRRLLPLMSSSWDSVTVSFYSDIKEGMAALRASEFFGGEDPEKSLGVVPTTRFCPPPALAVMGSWRRSGGEGRRASAGPWGGISHGGVTPAPLVPRRL